MIMARKKIIAGNWKMNMTPSQAVELINTLKPLVANEAVYKRQYRGGSQGLSLTYEQAHVGLDLLTLAP